MIIDPNEMRYFAEVALHFRSNDRFLHRASDHNDLADAEFQGLLDRVQDCHVYMIGKRPRVSIIPGSVSRTERDLHLMIKYDVQGEEFRSPISFPLSLFESDEVSFEVGPFPHRELISRGASGEIVAQTLLANGVHLFGHLPDKVRDIELLYIGQGTALSASDRLKSHSTLQRILGDVSAEDPESEVFVLLYSFEFQRHLQAMKGASFDQDKDAAHLEAIGSYQPTLVDKISLVEASCIGYFQPRYNTNLKGFPQCDLAALDRARAADFPCILVDLDNDPIGGVRVFTSCIPASSYHAFRVDLRKLSIKNALDGSS